MELSARSVELNKRLEMIAWGLFLVMLGALTLVPDSIIPSGSWLIGTGVIMIGLNIVRLVMHLPVSMFTIILGVLAMAAGISGVFGIEIPLLGVLLILLGLKLIFDVISRRAYNTAMNEQASSPRRGQR